MLIYGIGRSWLKRGTNPPAVQTPDVEQVLKDNLVITGGDVTVNEVGESDFITVDRQQLFFTYGAWTESETVGIFQDTLVTTGRNVTEAETTPITNATRQINGGDVAIPGDADVLPVVKDDLVITGRSVFENESELVNKDDLVFTGGTVTIGADTDAGSADTVPIVADTIDVNPATNGVLTPSDVGSIFVSTTGNDANPGTSASPKRSFQGGLAAVGNGGYVIVRGGTYTSAQNMTSGGTSAAKKTIRPFQGEQVIVDGASMAAGTIAVELNASNVRMIDIEVRNSKRMGIGSWQAQNIEIIGCRSHGNTEGGIWVGGGTAGASANNLIIGCRAWDNMRHNIGQAMGSGGWAVGIAIANSDNTVVRESWSYESWGEGIGILSSINAQIINCKVKDSFSVNFYLDNAQTGVVTNCEAWSTGNTSFYRSGLGPAHGGVIANENTSRMLPSSNITFNNNRFTACTLNGGVPVFYSTFGANTGLINSTILPNDFFANVAAYSAKHGPLPM